MAKFKRKFKKKKSKMASKVSKMSHWLSPPELKWITGNSGNTACLTGGTILATNPPVQGTGNSQRIGTKIRVIGYQVNYCLNAIQGIGLDTLVRLTDFRCKICNNTANMGIAIGDFYVNDTSGLTRVQSPLNPLTVTKPKFSEAQKSNPYVIYRDRTHRIYANLHDTPITVAGSANSAGPNVTNMFRKLHRFPKPIECTFNANAGALTDCVDNWFGTVLIASDSTGANYVGEITVFYYDA